MTIRIPNRPMTAAERSAWLLILSWQRRGQLVQQAHLTARTN